MSNLSIMCHHNDCGQPAIRDGLCYIHDPVAISLNRIRYSELPAHICPDNCFLCSIFASDRSINNWMLVEHNATHLVPYGSRRAHVALFGSLQGSIRSMKVMYMVKEQLVHQFKQQQQARASMDEVIGELRFLPQFLSLALESNDMESYFAQLGY